MAAGPHRCEAGVIKSIGDLASTAFLLSVALKESMVPNSDNVVICLGRDDAEIIYQSCLMIGRDWEDKIAVPVMSNRIGGEYRVFHMYKPPAPRQDGQPWMALFEIEVFVV